MVGAVPRGCPALCPRKKGADGGVDGLIYFRSDARTTERAIVSVKGGENVGVPMVRDLKGGRQYPRVQIITVAEALSGTKPAIPLVDAGAAFKWAPKEASDLQPMLDV